MLVDKSQKIKKEFKNLRDKACHIAKNPKNDGYQRGLASTVYKLFDKKSSGGAIKPMSNQ